MYHFTAGYDPTSRSAYLFLFKKVGVSFLLTLYSNSTAVVVDLVVLCKYKFSSIPRIRRIGQCWLMSKRQPSADHLTKRFSSYAKLS